jgi:cobalt/nickel transport system permease protein
METFLDTYATTNALRGVDTRIKLVFGIGSILLCIFSRSPILPLLVAAAMALVVVAGARIPGRLYAALLGVPFTFAVLSSAVVCITTGGGETLMSFVLVGIPVSIKSGGASLALLLLARTFGGMSSLFFIALTTPMVELFSVMRSLRLPQVFIDLSMLIYRYIFVFVGEAIMIHNAQVMRLGYHSFRASIRSFAMLGGMLFIRAWESGEQLLLAMDARCYNGHLEMPDGETAFSVPAFAAVAGYLVLGVLFAYLTRDWSYF